MLKRSRFKKLLFISISFITTVSEAKYDWRTADRSSAKIAPTPEEEKRAVVQIYVARTFGRRGYLAVHPWVSIKEKNADHYATYEVLGYRVYRGGDAVATRTNEPDTRWFGNEPEIIYDLRGKAAEKMIPKLLKAIESYPYPKEYRVWPGPNSNTFVSHVIRNTEGIYVELPPHAIGKDWIGKGRPVALSETGTGVQFSIFGLFGFVIGLAEGIEINILGMTFGIDFLRPALKLPFVGRVGMKDKPVFDITETDDTEIEGAKPSDKVTLH